MPILYTTQATATGGGRSGHAETSDGVLAVDLTVPKELGGDGARGTNPEQLFAAGYAACFSNALIHVAHKLGAPLSTAPVTAGVELLALDDGRFNFAITLDVALAATQPEQAAQAEQIVRLAHQTCPFSNAMRGNVVTRLQLNGAPLDKTA